MVTGEQSQADRAGWTMRLQAFWGEQDLPWLVPALGWIPHLGRSGTAKPLGAGWADWALSADLHPASHLDPKQPP